MQAALRDLTPTRMTNPRPFAICQRVLHRCHEIIFGDVPGPSRSPYRSLASPIAGSRSPLDFRGSRAKRKGESIQRVRAHADSAMVGMGVVLTGLAMPTLARLAGDWAVTQGRRPFDDETEARGRIEAERGGGADVSNPPRLDRKVSAASDESEDDHQPSGRSPHLTPPMPSRPSTSSHAQTTPNFSLLPTTPDLSVPHSATPSPRPKGEDPFSQQIEAGPSRPSSPRHYPFSSAPEIAMRPPQVPRSRARSTDQLLGTYDIDAQRQLLRSHYCRSEVRFLLLLEDISNRLLVVPKPARVSALRAELTSLNHNLPAEVSRSAGRNETADVQLCMPLWCAADHSHEEGGETSLAAPLLARPDRLPTFRRKGHSRIVRIPPGDSVVLNSAERAPFLLHVEILEGDLDFDPTKRENRELLKKIVVQEDLKRRKRDHSQHSEEAPDRLETFGSPLPDPIVEVPIPKSPKPPDLADTVDVEEVDLVEQLYGAKLSVRDILPQLSDTLHLPNAPKNKALDVAAWDRGGTPSEHSSRRGSMSGSPLLEPSPMPSTSPNGRAASPDLPPLLETKPACSSANLPGGLLGADADRRCDARSTECFSHTHSSRTASRRRRRLVLDSWNGLDHGTPLSADQSWYRLRPCISCDAVRWRKAQTRRCAGRCDPEQDHGGDDGIRGGAGHADDRGWIARRDAQHGAERDHRRGREYCEARAEQSGSQCSGVQGELECETVKNPRQLAMGTPCQLGRERSRTTVCARLIV